MKKLLSLFILLVLVTGVTFACKSFLGYSSDKIDDKHIYFFEQMTCPHCHHAKAYITQKYPNLAVQYRDVAQQENISDFMACADKFYLNKQQLGTPLICMGQHVILGWGEQEQVLFDQYVQEFLPAAVQK